MWEAGRLHTKKPAMVVELKYNKPVDTAIEQTRNRKYIRALEGYRGEILLVGVAYDREKKDKPHSCVIEKIERSMAEK